jgi:hypothetical protein
VFLLGKNQISEFSSGRGLEETDVSVMGPRGQLRTFRRRALAQCCAVVIIALVLCPFTAPFASYDPNASPIGGLLTQDGSLLDITCDKTPSVPSIPFAMPVAAHVVLLTAVSERGTTFDPLLLQSMVLRV